MVEHFLLNVLFKPMNPQYERIHKNTITSDWMKLHEHEKCKLKKIFKNANLISLTSDTWSFNQTTWYIFLTAYFLDSK